FVTEVIGTFVLVFVVVAFDFAGQDAGELGPLAVALLVVGIGARLGGPAGYALNPARVRDARLAHAVLPVKNRSGHEWRSSWVPVFGPISGGVLGGVGAALFF